MAYRRSICSRATLLARRFNPSIGYIPHDHNDNNNNQNDPSRTRIDEFLAQRRSFGTYGDNLRGHSFLFSEKRSTLGGYGGNGVSFRRNMSTSIGGGSEKAEYLSDVSGVISDAPLDAIATQAPVLSEVATAAADSAYPVAALQYVIDGIHNFTGLPWWASIAFTTLLIRSCTVPFLIGQLKATCKLTLMRPRLEEIKEEMQAKSMEPDSITEGKRKMNELFKEYGVTPFTPLKGLLIQGPVFVSFFFAISNMAEKVPSFKNGGALWFTDLTIPDSMYILPILTALTFLVNVEFNMQEGMEGNPIASTMKKFSRGLAVLTVPFTMNFPQAIFCYWITSNIFSFAYGSVLKMPGVKKTLGVPEIPVTPPSQNKQSSFSFFETLKQVSAASQKEALTRANPQLPKSSNSTTASSSSASPTSIVLSQRLRSLERQVKQKKKNKKR